MVGKRVGFCHLIVCSFLLTCRHVSAQEPEKNTLLEQTREPISTTGEKVVQSLDENDDEQLAKSYEELAVKFREKSNFKKAEEYFKKALATYRKLNATEDISRVSRSLAKVQEKLNKKKEAVLNYTLASSSSYATNDKMANSTDAKMVFFDANGSQSYGNSAAAFSESKSNIRLFKKQHRKSDLIDAYDKRADLFLFRNDYEGAIWTYRQALADAGPDPELIVRLKGKIADVYVRSKEFGKALAIRDTLLQEGRESRNPVMQIVQLRALSEICFQTREPDKALVLLKEAFRLALKSSNSSEAKAILTRLLDHYRTTGNQTESMALYDEFFRNFDALIRDSSLMDLNSFQLIEGKIRQLEKEKKLKDKLIANTRTFNYFLLGSLVVLLILLGLFVRALQSIKKRNKRIALQSLRREMNPHFIFNSLNSINQFISQNNELKANKYLTSYSNLMRTTMENSGKDFILLGKEVELLTKYLDLELMRFEDKFDFRISVDENLDAEMCYIPNMLIQPNLENAIWHGLRYLDGKGMLQLHFTSNGDQLHVTIDDNGIGMARSTELKTLNQKVYESLGLKNTNERIALLNNLYRKEIVFRIEEKPVPEQGTLVHLQFPLLDKLPG